MKKGNLARMVLAMSLMCHIPLQAETVNSNIVQAVSSKSIYTDTSTMSLPFVQIQGFFVSPLQVAGELLSAFGEVREGYTHQGIDIRAEEGTPIFAISDGVVIKAAPDSQGVNNGGGHIIIVDFGNGVEGRYMHLGGYGVKAGDKVRAGQVIGFTGCSGDSTTPLLHFEYRVDGQLMDPAFIFEMSGMIENNEVTSSFGAVNTGYDSGLLNTYSDSFFIIQK